MTTIYDEMSPITGEETVIIQEDSEGVKHKLCIKSGYNTNSKMIQGSEYVKEILSDKEQYDIVVDEDSFVWIPSVVYTEHSCILPYKNEESQEKFQWVVCSVNKTKDGEYFNPDNPIEKQGYKIDYNDCRLFGMFEFEDVLEYHLYKNLIKEKQ